MSFTRPGRARLSARGLLTATLATTALAVAPLPTGAAPSAPFTSSAATAAATGTLAPIVVGNADDDQFSGIIDLLRTGDQGQGFESAVDEDDGMAVGDLTGDGIDEVVVVDDDEKTLDVHDIRPGETFGDILFSWESRFDREEDDIAIGDVTDDNPGGEIMVADEEHGQVTVYAADGTIVDAIVQATGYDADDQLVVGNVTAGPLEEILIVNSEDLGRIDAFDGAGNAVGTIHSSFDGNDDDVALGQVAGDAYEDVVVANDEGDSRIESSEWNSGEVHTLHDTAYDSDDRIGVGAINGTGTDEIVIANTEESGRLDVIDFEQGTTNRDSGYDGDDRFAVGTGVPADIDDDGIPDQVELDGIRDGAGNIVDGWNLKAMGASPCRKDVLVDLDYMHNNLTGTAEIDYEPIPSGLGITGAHLPGTIELVADAMAGTGVPAVADCPYPGVDTSDGIGLHVDPITNRDRVSFDAVLDLPGEFDAIKAARLDPLLDPYVHYNLWIERFSEDGKTSTGFGRADAGEDPADFVISMYTPSAFADRQAQASTFMHELGHVIGLRHGGFEDLNCKPNYLSIMNYAFGLGPLDATSNPTLTFSPEKLDALQEDGGLDETLGIDGPADRQTNFTDKTGTYVRRVAADGPMNWDGVSGNAASGVVADVNALVPEPGGTFKACNSNPSDVTTVLEGHNDLATLAEDVEPLDFDGDESGGAAPGSVELTPADLIAQRDLLDSADFPDASVQLDAVRPGFHAASLGLATDQEHVYATHGYRTVTNPATGDRPGSLVVLDKETLAVEKRIEVGFGPRQVAVDPQRNRAYVTNSGKEDYSLSVIDTESQEVVGEVEIGQIPVDVAVNVGLNRVYVSNPFQQRIEVIDGATLTKLAPIQVGPAIGIAVDESRNTVYAALARRPGIPNLPAVAALATVIDDGVSKPHVLAPTPLGDFTVEPTDVAVDAIGDRIFLAGTGSGTAEPPSLVVVDQNTRQLVEKVQNRGPVRAVAVLNEAGLVAAVGDRGIDLYDVQRRDLVRRIDVGVPFSVAFGAGGSRQLYVGDFLSGQLHRRSLASGKPVG